MNKSELKEKMFSAHEEYLESGSRERLDAFEKILSARPHVKKAVLDLPIVDIDEYTDIVNEYPPSVQPLLGAIVRTFSYPYTAIPNKKKRSVYPRWVKELEDIKLIIGKHDVGNVVGTAFGIFQEQGRPFLIKTPASIRTLIINSLQQLSSGGGSYASSAGKKVISHGDKKVGADVADKSVAKELKGILDE